MTNPNDVPEVLFEGRHLQLVSRKGWEYADRPNVSGIVIIVAVTSENHLILVEQFRPPVNSRVIELPAGLAGDIAGSEDEELAEAARRELLEETGYAAETFTRLFAGPPSAGLSSEVLTFFRAEGLKKVDAGGGDDSEDIQIHEVPVDQVTDWLNDRVQGGGVCIDPKIYAGLYFAR
ncbi:MAG: NUDIX hydrolase [Planctomycetaceae bacterium]|nr:NUDIX hydrolase [Planctomycetaceae bacterium]